MNLIHIYPLTYTHSHTHTHTNKFIHIHIHIHTVIMHLLINSRKYSYYIPI